MSEIVGLYPGSFDPITNGHLDIIFRASKIVDKLIIGVAENEKKNHLYSASTRQKLKATSQNTSSTQSKNIIRIKCNFKRTL